LKTSFALLLARPKKTAAFLTNSWLCKYSLLTDYYG
jgi:hypothetical protein